MSLGEAIARNILPAPHVYAVYYDNPETSREFADFMADTCDHLKLLFCIDMLNEGVHVDDIDGVILLRPTISPILYLQQIGRGLSAGEIQECPFHCSLYGRKGRQVQRTFPDH